MNATQVNSYWRYVVKREEKAAKYHQELNAGRLTPYYNKNIPRSYQHQINSRSKSTMVEEDTATKFWRQDD
jgi:hypothetical protein